MEKTIKMRRFSNDAKYKKNTVMNNAEVKEWFLNEMKKTYDESYQNVAENLMYKVSNYEINFANGRDFYEMSYDEQISTLASFSSISPSVLSVYVSILKKYLDFCIEHKFIKNNINHLEKVSFDQLYNLINRGKVINRTITREEIYTLVEENLVNNLDRAIFLLIFEGVRGKQNIELEELKNEDIDIDNLTVTIRANKDRNEDKIIKVNRRLMNILQLAMMEKYYKVNNGKYMGRKKEVNEELLTIEETPYFFRPMRSRVNMLRPGDIKLTNTFFQRKVLLFCKEFLNIPYVSLTSLYNSGLVDRLIKYSEDNFGRVMTNKEFIIYIKENDEHITIAEIFNLYKEMWEKKQREKQEKK